MLYLIKTNVKIYKLLTSTQTTVIKYLKYQVPQKTEEGKWKSFAFCLNF